ncbi:MAG TPA: SDR family oxidoreductase [Oculatellaceae cyanobacterium]
MKVLVLGATGMLGHKLVQAASEEHVVYATIRGEQLDSSYIHVLNKAKIISGVRAEEFATVERAIVQVEPDVVINCIGIVKQLATSKDAIASILVNSLLPQKAALTCQSKNIRFITLSTDCVFSGRKGGYTLADNPDPVDLYGRSKLLGEVAGNNCLTIRTSMIGRQLFDTHSLVEWFLSQETKSVRGYKNAIFSGLTTNELSRIICKLISNHPLLEGIWQLAAKPISKFELLQLLKQHYNVQVEIVADEEFKCDRSLSGIDFEKATNLVPKSWPDMIAEMKNDSLPYPPRMVKC